MSEAAADPQAIIASLRAERDAALAREVALAEVLALINRSQGDPAPVFAMILEKAHTLCGATFGGLQIYDDGLTYAVASRGVPEEWAAFARKGFPNSDVPSMLARGERFVSIPDIQAIANPGESLRRFGEITGARSALFVPLRKDGTLLGAFTAYRSEVRPFAEQEIAVLESFAAQAVIAMENARLFDALRARTAELAARNSAYGEQITHQSATIDVLKTMSASPADPQPVFDLITKRALEICNGDAVALLQLIDGKIHFRSTVSNDKAYDPEKLKALRAAYPMPPSRTTTAGRVILDKQILHLRDMQAEPSIMPALLALGTRSQLSLPLLHDDVAVGAITLNSLAPGGFSDSQVALLKTFAEQAVIAIGSAETFRKLEQRTRDLTEALEIQSATADVLKAISRSAFDLDTVLDTLTRSAATLCNATTGIIHVRDGERFRLGATVGQPPQLAQYFRATPLLPGRGSMPARVALSLAVEQMIDVLTEPDMDPEVKRLTANRTVLGVPLIREGKAEGVFTLGRTWVEPFTQRQIELVQTFADQAMIAIENARLFDAVQARTRDLTEALEIQSATADVLKAISRSAFDLDTVLDTLTRSAATLCNANTGTVRVRDGEGFRLGASFNISSEFAEYVRSTPLVPGRSTLPGRVALSLAVEHIPDNRLDPELDPNVRRRTPNRSAIGVPLLREGRLDGVFLLGRTEPVPFTQRQIELVQTFADQAMIAIENARLFDAVQARTKELATSLEDLRAAQDRLIQTEKLASLGQLTAGIAHEIKNPLNFVNNFSALSTELIDELRTALEPAPLDATIRAEVDDLTSMLRGNLEKVVQHGKRADNIVKNMLLHSRESGGERRLVDLNATVEEALNLAYHGARAEKPGFNITLERDFDPAAGSLELYPQEFTRALLNLIGNGFYATTKKAETATPPYAPTLAVRTEVTGETVTIRIRDNGTGIPEDVRARIFNPFFTTKPAGEGTGLGLSLSHDIIVKQHGGRIDVDTVPGAFTEFTIILPRKTAEASK